MIRFRVLVGSLVLLLAVVFYPAGVTAHHSWGKYHWLKTSTGPLSLEIGDNVDPSSWNSHLMAAIGDWGTGDSSFDVLNLSTYTGSKNRSTCLPTLGKIEVCNAEYGENGWLGIAQVWVASASHIAQATTKLNDTYFKTPQYNSAAWRRFVVCQEVGHNFGLDHQDERFNNANLGSCMDYTNDPDGLLFNQLSNLEPNAHDFAQLASIYSHVDSTGGGGGGGTGRGRQGGAGLPPQATINQPGNSQASWGQMIASNGRMARFVLDLGNGGLVFTFVIWA